MRRLFIIRKDLHMSPGKVAAQVGHCAEVYWLHWLQNNIKSKNTTAYEITGTIDRDLFQEYICGSIVKTVCEARNKSHLLKAKSIAEEIGLIEGIDFGLIRDNCLTELTPEDEDGRTTTGIWFKPLPDDVAHQISKKYHLYV